ncbi:MAG: ferrous iron transport protein B [Burkholderiaceae bacterium]|nr:MAG: ferrous iron transport protein B [Burkholderiaceae bacterium]
MSASASAASYLLIGHPNVGKSVLFHRLTGAYVNVSNYPGTTVEVSHATPRFDADAELFDTPGVLMLPSRSEDERVTLRALFAQAPKAVVQVGDAKNLKRTLALTAVLAELKVPMVLALNMADEAAARGIEVDAEALSELLGIPVRLAVATAGEGVPELIEDVGHAVAPHALLHYDRDLEALITEVAAWIDLHAPHPHLASRGLAILWLGHDPVVQDWLQSKAPELYANLEQRRLSAKQEGLDSGRLARERAQAAQLHAERVVTLKGRRDAAWAQRIGRWVVHPVYSLPILALVLFAVYEFVGVFGAGFLVGLLEKDLFGEVLNPAFQQFVQQHVPWTWLSDLLVGEYGLWTMGMTYALALILPIVTTFFIAFGMLEDSGYFARLSVLANRAFSLIGLNGRAVLPMVLGLGCVTMSTLTTRILHSRRERLITTFLLALAIPCSAQLGVVLGMLGGMAWQATAVWMLAMVGVLMLAGVLAAKLVPGRRVPLVTELPPMRLPLMANVAKKTGGRLKWYLIEVIPLFLFGTLLMFVLDRTGVLPAIIEAGEPLVTGWLGLPKEASAAFVMGFLRRDFGATGLFALGAQLSPQQTVVGMVTITLFVPCIASMMMMIKEQGARTAALMIGMIVPFAFLVGGLLNHLLRLVW